MTAPCQYRLIIDIIRLTYGCDLIKDCGAAIEIKLTREQYSLITNRTD